MRQAWVSIRTGTPGGKCLAPMPVAQLPDGAMVQAVEESFLILQGRALQWSMAGYQKAEAAPDDAMLLTPPSTLRALGAGYRPMLHPSACS